MESEETLRIEEEVAEYKLYSIIKIQSMVRRYLIRSRAMKEIFQRYEKIWDPKRKRFYYYDKTNNKSSWLKPPLLLNKDLPEVAPTYLPEQAAQKIQNMVRKVLALHKVRLTYQAKITTIQDAKNGKRLYYNPLSGASYSKLPNFMKGRLNYRKTKKVKKRKNDSDSDDDDDSNKEEDNDDESDGLSLDSETIRQRRRLKRKYPRSKLQVIIDKAEDNIHQTFELNLSNFGAYRFSSRIYDFVDLKILNISYNHLHRLSSNFQYLFRLKTLIADYNEIQSIAAEISEIKKLEEFSIHHNRLSEYPTSFYRLKSLKRIDFSFNQFTEVPLEVGNLELLKELGEWEVGIGLLVNLTYVNFSNNQIVEFPSQLERLPVLKELHLSDNVIEELPVDIENMKSLILFHIENNRLKALPVEFYDLTGLEEFHAHHNFISALPNPFEVDGKKSSKGTSVQPSPRDPVPPPPNISGIASPNSVTSKSTHQHRQSDAFTVLSHPSVDSGNTTAKEAKYPQYPYDLTRLRLVDLSYNSFKVLTNELLIFSGIIELNLSHNQLKSIQDYAFGRCKRLQRLDLSYNQLNDLPISLMECKELHTLRLSYNQFTFIPKSLQRCMKLINFYMDHNQLMELDGKIITMFYDLEIIDLSYNSLKELSLLLFSIKKLISVNLSYNQIKLIPDEIENWNQKLSYLNLSYNQIGPTLPSTIGFLSNCLEVLYLHHNLIEELPDSIYQLIQLKQLTLHFNCIKQSPYLLYSLPNLIHCNLSHNEFEYCHDLRQHYVYIKRSLWSKDFHSLVKVFQPPLLGKEEENRKKEAEVKGYREIIYDIPHIRRELFYLREYSDCITGNLPKREKEFYTKIFTRVDEYSDAIPVQNDESENKNEHWLESLDAKKKDDLQGSKKTNSNCDLFLHWLQKLRIHFNMNKNPLPLKSSDKEENKGSEQRKKIPFPSNSLSLSYSYSTISEDTEQNRPSSPKKSTLTIDVTPGGGGKPPIQPSNDKNQNKPSGGLVKKPSSGFLSSFSFRGNNATATATNKTPSKNKGADSHVNNLSNSFSFDNDDPPNRPSSAAPPPQMNYLSPDGKIKFNHPKLLQQFFIFHFYSRWQQISWMRNQFFLSQLQLTTNRPLLDYNHDINNPPQIVPPPPAPANLPASGKSTKNFRRMTSKVKEGEKEDQDDDSDEDEPDLGKKSDEEKFHRYHYSKAKSLLQQNISISSQKQLEKKLFGLMQENNIAGEKDEEDRKKREEKAQKLFNDTCFFGSEELFSIIHHGSELISLTNILVYLEEFQTMKAKVPKNQWQKPSTVVASPQTFDSPPRVNSPPNALSPGKPLSPNEPTRPFSPNAPPGDVISPLVTSPILSPSSSQKIPSTTATVTTGKPAASSARLSLFSTTNKQKRRSTDDTRELNKKMANFQKDINKILGGRAMMTTDIALTSLVDNGFNNEDGIDSNRFIDEIMLKYGNLLDAEELLQDMITLHYEQFHISHDPLTESNASTEVIEAKLKKALGKFATSGDSANIIAADSRDSAPSRSRSLSSFQPLSPSQLLSPSLPPPPKDHLLAPTQSSAWMLSTIRSHQRRNNVLFDTLPLTSLPLSLIHSQERLIRHRYMSESFGEANVPLTEVQLQANVKKSQATSQGTAITQIAGALKKTTPAMAELMRKHELKQKLRRSFIFELPNKNYPIPQPSSSNDNPRLKYQMITESCYQDDSFSEYSIFSCFMEAYSIVIKAILLHVENIEKMIRQIERQFLHQPLFEKYYEQQNKKSLSQAFTFVQLFSCMELSQRYYYYSPRMLSEKEQEERRKEKKKQKMLLKKKKSNLNKAKIEKKGKNKKGSQSILELEDDEQLTAEGEEEEEEEIEKIIIEKKEDYDDIFYDIYLNFNLNMKSQEKNKESSANKSISQRRQKMVDEFLRKFYSNFALESIGITPDDDGEGSLTGEEKVDSKKTTGRKDEPDVLKSGKNTSREPLKSARTAEKEKEKEKEGAMSDKGVPKLQKQNSMNSTISNITMDDAVGANTTRTPLRRSDTFNSFFSQLQASQQSVLLNEEEARDYIELLQEYRSLWYFYALQILQNYQEILHYRGFTPSLILEYYLKRAKATSSSHNSKESEELDKYHEKILQLISSELQNYDYQKKNQNLFNNKIFHDEKTVTSLLLQYRIMIEQLGKVYQGLGMYSMAIDCFSQYLQLSKGMNLSKQFYINLIKLYLSLGNYYKANQLMLMVIQRFIATTTTSKNKGDDDSYEVDDNSTMASLSTIVYTPLELMNIDREIAILYYYILNQYDLVQSTCGNNKSLDSILPTLQQSYQHQLEMNKNHYFYNSFYSMISDQSYLHKIQNIDKMIVTATSSGGDGGGGGSTSYENIYGRSLLDNKYKLYQQQENKKHIEKEKEKEKKIHYLNDIHSIKSKAMLLLEDSAIMNLLKENNNNISTNNNNNQNSSNTKNKNTK